MTLESVVEGYLCARVVLTHAGLCEKYVSPGRRGVPDRLVTIYGRMDLVETKAPGQEARKDQVRDHKRRAARGVPVYLLDTKEKVDDYLCCRAAGLPALHLYSVPLPS